MPRGIPGSGKAAQKNKKTPGRRGRKPASETKATARVDTPAFQEVSQQCDLIRNNVNTLVASLGVSHVDAHGPILSSLRLQLQALDGITRSVFQDALSLDKTEGEVAGIQAPAPAQVQNLANGAQEATPVAPLPTKPFTPPPGV